MSREILIPVAAGLLASLLATWAGIIGAAWRAGLIVGGVQ